MDIRIRERCGAAACGCGCGQVVKTPGAQFAGNHWIRSRPEHISRMHAAQRGKKHSEEFKLRLREMRLGEQNPRWKGGAVKSPEAAGRRRAKYRFQITSCADCGAAGRDRHHIDGNPLNNNSENVVCLCRRCHMRRDGRLNRLVANRPTNVHRDTQGRFQAVGDLVKEKR